ncbi:hypothetical protein DEJ49_35030 [Streptomyces venezuelae]|uniref:Uncharacterized protein n=1 Tax=Streptomyces venezuelae TaxID=54571 RepID=A0A5P2CSW3_STRVZ|nr:hypothetical protein [Streptomyces venezuelae]QES45513.1 hypothetical protein DEJ49_35030 [Streptomyces venezuelae]
MSERMPRPPPPYSDDLVEADVLPLREFLRARLAELEGRWPIGSDERFAARALTNAMLSTAMRLTEEISTWRRALAEGRGEEPGLLQTLRHDIGHDFNLLVWVAQQWRAHPDHAHWRPRHYLNAAHLASLLEPQSGGSSADAVRGPYGHEAHP